MTTRIDIHRPSQVIPSDYEFVAVEVMKIECLGDCYALKAHREEIRQHMAKTGGKRSTHAHGGNCHVCGAHCVYTCLFYHAKTNTYIRTGFDCSEKLEYNNEKMFRAIKKDVKSALEARAGKQRAKALLTEAGLGRAWELVRETSDDDLIKMGAVRLLRDGETTYPSNDFMTLTNIVSKLQKYGSLSDKQINYVSVLISKIEDRNQRLAKYAEEKKNADDAPSGRCEVVCEILKLTWDEDFEINKVFAKAESGFTVYGTLPSCLNNKVTRGDRIKFRATFTPADNDPKHAFFKRPSNAEIVGS